VKGVKEQALKLLEEAYRYHLEGNLDKAVELYRRSIELYPTPEAWTFLGWAYSMRGNLEGAVEACKRAIELDPEYGNPYNDIGFYLIEMGKLDEALSWLEKAKKAKRYASPHLPYVNAAKVYLLKGELFKALDELNRALRIKPGYLPALIMKHQVLGMLN